MGFFYAGVRFFESEFNMRRITVPLASVAAGVLLTVAVMSVASNVASLHAQARGIVKGRVRDEWAYKGGKNPA